MLKKILILTLIFILPSALISVVLKFLGFHIGKNLRIGFSLIYADKIYFGDNVKIGHLNLILIRRLICLDYTSINRLNIFYGPITASFKKNASVGNRNKFIRGQSPEVVDWAGVIKLEQGARITSDHVLDCTRNIKLGEYSILAGSHSQLWTHGYIHDYSGPGRYRVDGSIEIGPNVYLGSRIIITMGIKIAQGCIIGAGSTVSKSINTPALYVGAALRQLPRPINPVKNTNISRELSKSLCEPVYKKNKSTITS